MKLNMSHRSGTDSGYGRMGTEIHRSLERLGVEVTPGVTDTGPVHKDYLSIGHPAHIDGWWEGQSAHVFTMWEATVMPPGGREQLHEFETVFVPAQHDVDLWGRFHPRVIKVPLGVNPDVWHPTPRPDPGANFTFLTAGNGPRKGIDIAVRAFNTVFADYKPTWNEPTPKLIVKNLRSSEHYKGEFVTQHSAILSDEDEVALYQTAQCYIGAARGEGWGLAPLQAIAQGIPTILTNAHGHAEFAELGIPISTHMVPAERFVYGDAGEWWEPDFDEICEAMWDVYTGYDEHVARAGQNAYRAIEEFTWDRAAQNLINHLGLDIASPDIERTVRHKLTVKLYHVVANKPCAYEINGESFRFEPGKEYWERGDLKRMMFENDNLDPVCLQDPHELGLFPDEVKGLDAYAARNARCPTCHQVLNTNTVDVDDLTDDELDDVLGRTKEGV